MWLPVSGVTEPCRLAVASRGNQPKRKMEREGIFGKSSGTGSMRRRRQSRRGRQGEAVRRAQASSQEGSARGTYCGPCEEKPDVPDATLLWHELSLRHEETENSHIK